MVDVWEGVVIGMRCGEGRAGRGRGTGFWAESEKITSLK